MDAKKTISANLETQKGSFLLIGFVLVFGLFFIAFEWTKQLQTFSIASLPVDVSFIDEEIQATTQPEKVLPPPPKVVVPIINVVPDYVKTAPGPVITSEPDPITIVPPEPIKVIIDDPDVPAPIDIPEVQPSFPGGLAGLYEYLNDNVVYPAAQKEIGVQGRVSCQFIVNTDGSIVDAKVVRGVDPALDEEAIRVIQSMPKWIPGMQANKKVRVRFNLPVVFQIKEN